MKRLLVILFILFSVLIFDSCKDFHPFDRAYPIYIQNDSRKLIYFLVSFNYPDTLIPNEKDKISYVPAWDKTRYDSKEKWKKVFEDLPANKLSIFIFEEDIYDDYEWNEIRNQYMIAKRYDVTYDDLEKNDMTIIYQ